MPLPQVAQEMLANFSEESGDFALFGIFINPLTGEMGTYSSHGMPPGEVLGFLQRAVETMVTAAANNELEYIGGDNNGMAQGCTPAEIRRATGGKFGLVN